MPLVTWSNELSVGINSIDDQHRKLVVLLNALDNEMRTKGKEGVGKIFDGLIDGTVSHFRYEEELLAKTRFVDGPAHKLEHAQLLRHIMEIKRKFDQAGPAALTIPVMNFLKDWLTLHIQGSDKRYVRHLLSKGVW